eukprot:1083565-Amphidinium_carterae.1
MFLSLTQCMGTFGASCEFGYLRLQDAVGARGHVFHYKCMDAWLSFARTCPLCRRDVVEASARCIIAFVLTADLTQFCTSSFFWGTCLTCSSPSMRHMNRNWELLEQ